MKAPYRQLTISCGIMTLAGAALLLLLSSPLRACTVDEIIAMDEAGIPPEVVIEVIEATGLDDPVDIELITDLAELGVDSAVLEYLAGYLEQEAGDEEDADTDDDDEESNRHPNWGGGEGFHHGGTGYNPLRDNEPASSRRDNRRYQPYDYRYNPDRSVLVYEPPVYVLYNRPYYRAYRAPRYYDRGRYPHDWPWYVDDRWFHPRYTYTYPRYGTPWSGDYPFDDWWRDYRWRGHEGWGGDLRGGWYYDGRHHWDGGFNIWWSNDDFSLGLHF
jgi:hypothetical protein